MSVLNVPFHHQRPQTGLRERHRSGTGDPPRSHHHEIILSGRLWRLPGLSLHIKHTCCPLLPILSTCYHAPQGRRRLGQHRHALYCPCQYNLRGKRRRLHPPLRVGWGNPQYARSLSISHISACSRLLERSVRCCELLAVPESPVWDARHSAGGKLGLKQICPDRDWVRVSITVGTDIRVDRWVRCGPPGYAQGNPGGSPPLQVRQPESDNVPGQKVPEIPSLPGDSLSSPPGRL